MKRYIPTKPEPENKPMQSATQAAVLAPPRRQTYSNLVAQTVVYASLPQAHATRLQNLASGGGARDMTGSRKYVPHAGVRSARAMWYTPRLDLTNRTSSAVPKVSGLGGDHIRCLNPQSAYPWMKRQAAPKIGPSVKCFQPAPRMAPAPQLGPVSQQIPLNWQK